MKAAAFGLAGVVLLCGLNYINDSVLRQTTLIGNNMPMSVYGPLIIFLILFVPLLQKIRRTTVISGKQLAIALAMVLAVCCIPGYGLLRLMTCSLVFPHHYEKIEPGWKEQGVIEMTPAHMLVDAGKNEDAILNGFRQGLAVGERHIGFSEIPWEGWVRTLSFWLPLMFVLWVGLIALSLVVHRQWSENEHLPYPIAVFTDSLLPREGGRAGSAFSSRLFWIGLGTVLALHSSNYLYEWFPGWIQIPTAFNLQGLGSLFPNLQRGGGEFLLKVNIFFTPMALAFFLASDVSFSVGIGPFLWFWVSGVLAGFGLSLKSGGGGWGYMGPSVRAFLNFGAFLGFLLVIIFAGRHYYLKVFRQAVGLPTRERSESQYVWAFRVFLLCLATFMLYVWASGLDWWVAVLYSLGVFMVFLVLGRIISETGLFYMQPYFFPSAILWGLCGALALGPRQLLIMFVFGMVLLVDPRESLMPYMVNSLKLLEMRGVKLGKTAILCVVALFVGLSVALPVTLYFQYDRGADMDDGWATKEVPKMPFDNTVVIKHRLAAQGRLELAESLQGWQRFPHLSANTKMLMSLLCGVGLVVLFSRIRWALPRWPLHPVMFLVWSTYPAWKFAWPFLLGWFIKTVIMKYGGERMYQRAKPLMFGAIAGDMLGGIIPVCVGFVYYLVTGEMPKPYNAMNM